VEFAGTLGVIGLFTLAFGWTLGVTTRCR